MGWPPTKAGWLTAEVIGLLTPATSVTTAAPASSRRRATPATSPTGVAITARSQGPGWPKSSTAPMAAAISARSESGSIPVTRHPAARRARPTDPPIKPVPATMADGPEVTAAMLTVAYVPRAISPTAALRHLPR